MVEATSRPMAMTAGIAVLCFFTSSSLFRPVSRDGWLVVDEPPPVADRLSLNSHGVDATVRPM